MYHSPVSLLKKKYKSVFGIGLLVAIASGVLSLLFPLEYRADAQVLVISRARVGVDPYAAAKSAEQVGESLAQIIKTNDFYQKVVTQTTIPLDKSVFDGVTSERKKRKLWEDMVDGSAVFGTGAVTVSVYHVNPDQAIAYANAITQILVERSWDYVGQDVVVKVVNAPVATEWPARPNIPLNVVLGFMVGVVGMGLYAVGKR